MNKMLIIAVGLLALMVLAGCSKPNNITNNVVNSEDAQIVHLGLNRQGYTPKEITVEANKPVTIKNDGTLGGCGLYPMQPELGMNANFAQSDEYTFTPTKKGKYTFTCSMGMYKGTMNVV